MKRLVAAAITGMAALALTAPAASAESVAQATVVRCEATATWRVTVGLTSYADLAGESPLACKWLAAHAEDDLDFYVTQFDFGSGLNPYAIQRYNLTGAFVTGAATFAAVASSADGTVNGTMKVAGEGTLNATLIRVTPSFKWTMEFVPLGSCGTDCYRTKLTWVWSQAASV
jgi:hypothetical protein